MAKKKIETTIDIQATPETVWRILTDVDAYPEWNPFIKQLSGQLAVGQTLQAKIADMSFQPVLLAVEPNRELRWKGKLLINGLFDGEHSFIIEPKGEGVTFRHSEIFSGILVRLFAKKLDTETRDGFEAMNRALKAHAEIIQVEA